MSGPFDFKIEDDHGIVWTPWTDGHQVGFRCDTPDGRTVYTYLSPSQTDPEADDTGQFYTDATVFYYEGTEGEPSQDGALSFYVIADKIPVPEDAR